MKTFLWTISSSNEKSLNNFLKLFNFKNSQVNIVKINKTVRTKKVVTLLKSPHVNKTAQEQFEKRKKLVQIFLTSGKFNKVIVKIKKVLIKLFIDLKLTVEHTTNSTFSQIRVFNILKPSNFTFHNFKKTPLNKSCCDLDSKKEAVKFKTFLELLNVYGELRQETTDSDAP